MRRLCLIVAVSAVFAYVLSAQGDIIYPDTYRMPNGDGTATGGTWNYWDQTYSGSGSTTTDHAPLSGGVGQLTDDILGDSVDFRANLGNGPAYEWVGWRNSPPIITFDFGTPVVLDNVALYINTWPASEVWAPYSITLRFSNDDITYGDDVTYSLTSPELNANNISQWINVPMDRNYQYARMSFDHPGDWMMISEVQFTPEPATMALLGIGGVMLLIRKRRS